MTAGVAELHGRVRPPELSSVRTIDRTLVHRASVAEVFVTDLRELDTLRFLAAAQLPLSHGHYSDHVRRPTLFDPMLLLECGRQVGIAAAHAGGVPADVIMLVGEFSLRLPTPSTLVVGRKPGQLEVDNVIVPLKLRGGRVRRGVVRQELRLDGVHVGTHTMECQLVSHTELAALRHTMRGTPAPSTADMGGEVHPRQLAPHLVGRVNPLNVVVSQAIRDEYAVNAMVTPSFDNRALFDHDYDHVPAMTLTEAARQLALVATDDGTGRVLAHTVVTGIDGRFHRFAELDEPLSATAMRTESGSVKVTFTQSDVVVAELSITVLVEAGQR